MQKAIEKGTVKVVWIKDADTIRSKMFGSVDEAVKFAENKDDFLVFKLLGQKGMEEFSWEILPYGRYNLYKKLLTAYKKGNIFRMLNKLKPS